MEKPQREARGALQLAGSVLEIVPMMPSCAQAEPKKGKPWRTFWTTPKDYRKEVDEADDDAEYRR